MKKKKRNKTLDTLHTLLTHDISPERLPVPMNIGTQAGTRRALYTLDALRTSKILRKILFYTLILVFLAASKLSDSPPPPSGWYQQFMPDIGGRQINDITFTDSLTGYAITNRLSSADTSFILKTTNGGENWSVIYREKSIFTRIEFLNQNTGFVGGSIYVSPSFYILKTTNGGSNWYTINAILNQTDMSVLDENTIWLVSDNGLSGGIYRTTNGGLNWDLQFSQFNNNPNKIYMYNQNIGFACTNFVLFKTTNSGMNWIPISGTSQSNKFFDMYFVDSLVGWRTDGDSMKITTDGGYNWSNQVLPHGGMLISIVMTLFHNISRDTIWGTGGYILYPNNQAKAILYRTTNGGINWLFQVPDTSFSVAYHFINFTNRLTGWSYSSSPTGIHTTNGGDTTFYIGIQQIPNAVPEGFVLKQNYPNPFNPRTVIPYSLSASAHVKIIAYDITGREVQCMVDQYQQAGAYEVDFMGKFTASGVYFYRMIVTDEKGKVVYTNTKKMILLK